MSRPVRFGHFAASLYQINIINFKKIKIMKEYLLIFRSEAMDPTKATPEQQAEGMEKWKNWMGSLAQQGKFTSGQPLTGDGRFMHSKTKITDAPFAEGKEVVSGYLLIKGNDYNDAVESSKGCPVFDNGGTVEVREIMLMNM